MALKNLGHRRPAYTHTHSSNSKTGGTGWQLHCADNACVARTHLTVVKNIAHVSTIHLLDDKSQSQKLILIKQTSAHSTGQSSRQCCASCGLTCTHISFCTLYPNLPLLAVFQSASTVCRSADGIVFTSTQTTQAWNSAHAVVSA